MIVRSNLSQYGSNIHCCLSRSFITICLSMAVTFTVASHDHSLQFVSVLLLHTTEHQYPNFQKVSIILGFLRQFFFFFFAHVCVCVCDFFSGCCVFVRWLVIVCLFLYLEKNLSSIGEPEMLVMYSMCSSVFCYNHQCVMTNHQCSVYVHQCSLYVHQCFMNVQHSPVFLVFSSLFSVCS